MAQRPNFVVIVADDAGWGDVGYHDSEIATPNLDRLAKSGVELDNFYVSPTCSPTRAAMMLGKPPSRVGIFTPVGGVSAESLPADSVTLPKLLRRAGYATAISGKWHLGERPEIGPRQFGFDESYGSLRGQVDPYTHLYKTGEQTWHRNGKYLDEQGHATDLITDNALAFLRKQADRAAPWFLYVAYTVPHYPLDEPAAWVDPYREKIPNQSRRLYAASMTHMDHKIGELVAALDETNQAENTLLVFFSDNGGQRSFMNTATVYDGRYTPYDRLGSNSPLRGWKTQLHEGAIRVPAIAAWPGKLASRKVTQVLSVRDLYPTFAGLAGASIPPKLHVEGIDAWSALTGQEAEPEDRTLYWRTPGAMAVRKGPWKLIHRGKTLERGADELYNLTTDPLEKSELSAERPEVLADMRAALAEQRVRD